MKKILIVEDELPIAELEKDYLEPVSYTHLNTPRYLVIDFSKAERERGASTEDVMAVSEKLIQQNMEAYEVLAK